MRAGQQLINKSFLIPGRLPTRVQVTTIPYFRNCPSRLKWAASPFSSRGPGASEWVLTFEVFSFVQVTVAGRGHSYKLEIGSPSQCFFVTVASEPEDDRISRSENSPVLPVWHTSASPASLGYPLSVFNGKTRDSTLTQEGCHKLQVISRGKRATNYRALLQKMTYEDKASYNSTPPCSTATRNGKCCDGQMIVAEALRFASARHW